MESTYFPKTGWFSRRIRSISSSNIRNRSICTRWCILNLARMMQKLAKIETAAHSDLGRVRRANEDAFGYCLDAGFFIVCDGMGGAAAGEIASRLTVDTMIERICSGIPGKDERTTLEESIAAANRLVYARAAKDTSLHGMGTTLVAALVSDTHALIAHVGDSRCYLFRAGALQRQTKDHSLVDEQVRLGQMTQDEADCSPLRNVITRAIGTQKTVAAEITGIDLEPDDLLLLCSDGLTRELSDDQIAEMLSTAQSRGEDTNTTCRKLIEAANRAGGCDNITCILVKVHPES
jgi:PPM family protein phosphatase